MSKDDDTFGIISDDISDESVDFHKLQEEAQEDEEDGDDVLKSF